MKHVLALLMPLVLLASCASHGTNQQFANEVAQLRESLAELQAQPAAKDVVPAAQPVELPLSDNVDVLADDVPLRVFLMGLVEGTDYNMVVQPEVEGRVNLELKGVSLAEVLGIVREQFGLHVEREGQIIKVRSDEMQTRIFSLDYVNLSRSGQSEMQVSTGSIKDSGTNAGTNAGANNNRDRSSNRDSGSGNDVVGSRVQTQSKVELWETLSSAIGAIIGEGEGRKVIVMNQAGVIVVTALLSELASVDQFLSLSESALQRQVILEAKILEVELSQQFQSGVNWTELGELTGSEGGPVNFSLQGNPLQSSDGGVFGVGVDFKDFDGFIQLLETQGNVNVLSSPRIATVNNQKAVIKVGTDEFFVTNVSSTTTTGTSTTTTPSVTLTPFFSGIALDVTPQISREGDVILHIHPTVSEVTDQNKVVTIGDDTVNLPLALSTIRESDSIVRASNNQVIVIGGLMKSASRNSNAGAPLLGRLPLLGRGFSQQRQSSSQSELVILVRPIVVDAGSQKQQVNSSLERIDKLGLK